MKRTQEGAENVPTICEPSKPRIREDVGNAKDNGCDRGSEGVGREGTESQQDNPNRNLCQLRQMRYGCGRHRASEYKDCGPVGTKCDTQCTTGISVRQSEDVADRHPTSTRRGNQATRCRKCLAIIQRYARVELGLTPNVGRVANGERPKDPMMDNVKD